MKKNRSICVIIESFREIFQKKRNRRRKIFEKKKKRIASASKICYNKIGQCEMRSLILKQAAWRADFRFLHFCLLKRRYFGSGTKIVSGVAGTRHRG